MYMNLFAGNTNIFRISLSHTHTYHMYICTHTCVHACTHASPWEGLGSWSFKSSIWTVEVSLMFQIIWNKSIGIISYTHLFHTHRHRERVWFIHNNIFLPSGGDVYQEQVHCTCWMWLSRTLRESEGVQERSSRLPSVPVRAHRQHLLHQEESQTVLSMAFPAGQWLVNKVTFFPNPNLPSCYKNPVICTSLNRA